MVSTSAGRGDEFGKILKLVVRLRQQPRLASINRIHGCGRGPSLLARTRRDPHFSEPYAAQRPVMMP